MIGIDGDIEKLVSAVQKRDGGTRASANAELVRRLSTPRTPTTRDPGVRQS
jgi:hypothetical protein